MKFLLLCLITGILVINCLGQPTHFSRLSFNGTTAYLHPEDSILHFLDYAASPSGDAYILAGTERGTNKVFKLTSGCQYEWESAYIGYHGTMTNTWITGLTATPDGGCVFAYMWRSWSVLDDMNTTILKYKSNGVLEWSTTLPVYTPFTGITYQETFDIALIPSGYACLSCSTTYLINPSGMITDSLPYHGQGSVHGFNNGDFYFKCTNFQGRTNSSGQPIYVDNGEIHWNDTSMYKVIGDSIYTIDALTGIPVNATYFSSTGLQKICMLHDGGWVAYGGDTMVCFANNGIIKWAKKLNLPYFGINHLGEQLNGTLMTGGTYKSSWSWFLSTYELDYSSFVFTIDSMGESIVDSVDIFYPGDANDDGFFEYSDAVFAALAQGSTGLVRVDPGLMNALPMSIDIGVDFQNSFAMGVNHKHSDFNGDGLVDSIDITSIVSVAGTFNGPVPYKIGNLKPKSVSNSAVPQISITPVQDSVSIGDTVRFYLTAGMNGSPVDSIFGFAVCLDFDWNLGMVLSEMAVESDLGLMTDLNYWSNAHTSHPYIADIVIGRNDLQNSYNVQDTLGYIDILIIDSLGGDHTFSFNVKSLRAITAGGFDITFNPDIGSVYIHPDLTSVNEISSEKIEVYPNPAKDKLTVGNIPGGSTVNVFDVNGKKHFSSVLKPGSQQTDIAGLIPGEYILVISDTEGIVYRKKIIVVE